MSKKIKNLEITIKILQDIFCFCNTVPYFFCSMSYGPTGYWVTMWSFAVPENIELLVKNFGVPIYVEVLLRLQ